MCNDGPLFMLNDIQCFYQLQECAVTIFSLYSLCVSMATRVEVCWRQQIYTMYTLRDHVSNHSVCVNHFHLGPVIPTHRNVINLQAYGVQFKGVFPKMSQVHFDQFSKKPFFLIECNWNIKFLFKSIKMGESFYNSTIMSAPFFSYKSSPTTRTTFLLT